jgi:[ribosomal protein S18]-alanine N-acetyltransferase
MWLRSMTLEDGAALTTAVGGAALGIDIRAELNRELTRAWVAADAPVGGQVLAYALGWWVVDELQVLAIETLPAARRRGVARALLAHVIAAARAAGGQRITLEVGRDNSGALRLYQDAGFCVFNVRRGYYRKTGEDALEMELGLARLP